MYVRMMMIGVVAVIWDVLSYIRTLAPFNPVS